MQSPAIRSPALLKVVAIVVTVGFAFPAGYLVWRNFTFQSDPLEVLFSQRTRGPLLRTLRLAVLVSASTAVLGTALAWLTTRCDVPLRRLWQVLLPLPLVFPTFIGAAALIRTLNPGGLLADWLDRVGLTWDVEMRGLFGAWLALTLFTYPYVYLPVAARLRRLPGSAEETARLLGDGPLAIIRRVVLPQTATAISAGTLLVFLYAISDFGAVQLMRYDTLSRAIYTTRLSNQPVSLALSVILLVLAAVVVLVERAATRRYEVSAPARSRRPVMYRLGRAKPVAVAFLAAAVAVGLLGPLASLADWTIDGIKLNTSGGRDLLVGWDDVWSPTWNTAFGSIAAAAVAVAAVLPAAYLVVRYRSRIGTVANAVIVSAFALPGILIGLALLFWTLKTDIGSHLRNTWCCWCSPMWSASADRACAPPKWRWPQSRPSSPMPPAPWGPIGAPLPVTGTAAHGAGAFGRRRPGDAVGDEGATITLLIAPVRLPTLTTKAFNSIEEAFVAEAGIWSGTLVVLSGVLTWFFVVRRADHFD